MLGVKERVYNQQITGDRWRCQEWVFPSKKWWWLITLSQAKSESSRSKRKKNKSMPDIWTFNIYRHQSNFFLWEMGGYFSRTTSDPILQNFQQHGFIDAGCVGLTGLDAVQICLLSKMHGASRRGESDNNKH